MNAYTQFKPAWHADRIATLRAGHDIVPTHVQLVISDLCNQGCSFCSYRMDGGFSSQNFADADGNRNPARFIPTEKCKEILDDCAELGVKAIQFTGGGEPTVHKDHIEIIGYAQSLNLQTALVTNGVRPLDHEVFRNLDWLRISLDAGQPATYERTRRSKMWPKVMDNLRLAGTFERPYVGVGFVVTPDNYTEIVDACAIIKRSGIPYIRLSAMFSEAGSKPYRGIYDEIKQSIKCARMLETESFRIVDLFGNRIEDLDQGKPEYSFCGAQQFTLYIGGDQKVYTCCTNSYTSAGEIGNLHNMRFKDWLRMTRRYDFDARKCHHCQFNSKNRLLNYLVDKAPVHVDFV